MHVVVVAVVRVRPAFRACGAGGHKAKAIHHLRPRLIIRRYPSPRQARTSPRPKDHGRHQ